MHRGGQKLLEPGEAGAAVGDLAATAGGGEHELIIVHAAAGLDGEAVERVGGHGGAQRIHRHRQRRPGADFVGVLAAGPTAAGEGEAQRPGGHADAGGEGDGLAAFAIVHGDIVGRRFGDVDGGGKAGDRGFGLAGAGSMIGQSPSVRRASPMWGQGETAV